MEHGTIQMSANNRWYSRQAGGPNGEKRSLDRQARQSPAQVIFRDAGKQHRAGPPGCSSSQNINLQENRLIKARTGLPIRQTRVAGKRLTQRTAQESRYQTWESLYPDLASRPQS